MYKKFNEIYALLGYYAASRDVVPKRRQTITTRRHVISQKREDLINIAEEA
jgi:hypothetical protein